MNNHRQIYLHDEFIMYRFLQFSTHLNVVHLLLYF